MTSLKLITSAKANGTVPVSKYESPSTGLKVVVANVEGIFALCLIVSSLSPSGKCLQFKVLFAVASSLSVSFDFI